MRREDKRRVTKKESTSVEKGPTWTWGASWRPKGRGRATGVSERARGREARGYSGDVVTGEGGWFGRDDGRGGARSLGGAIPNGCTAKKWRRASHLESDEDLILGVDAVEDGLPSVPVLEVGRATVL